MENKIVVAVKGVIVNDGRVLIVKRASNDEIGAGTWECVGGKIEFGEELETALIREIKEEVGLNVTVEKLLYATTFKTSPTRQVVILTYLCRSEVTDVRLSVEHLEYLWATKDQLKQLLHQGILEDFEKNNVFSIQELL
ncbi:NUDIX hydrolase [Pseudobacteroides cellulosolvens]|uniref:NUDIX hydrolase n=1 Tax=Pseudobacteroides cellulosolvens ATCC 35603 = DSM 2933 TaxID=398512 RepID=A0A0L6JIC2_9FIRM|nr:NUDIX domain-containing protein [Pseudobacteroides cellulosolvens]KNY25475.1 NUDIX hydrolase [Pseudobacteroides cellulosolvens ATCC 35603 = DSM 2933]